MDDLDIWDSLSELVKLYVKGAAEQFEYLGFNPYDVREKVQVIDALHSHLLNAIIWFGTRGTKMDPKKTTTSGKNLLLRFQAAFGLKASVKDNSDKESLTLSRLANSLPVITAMVLKQLTFLGKNRWGK